MQKRLRTFAGITIVIIITIVFHYLGWLSLMENFLRALVIPGSKSMYNLSVEINTEEVDKLSLEDLQIAYKKLLAENLDLKTKAAALASFSLENEELKKQLNFIKRDNFKSIGASVIGKNIDSLGNNIIIDCGLINGCKLSDAVVVQNGVLIGKIARIEEHLAVVRLINDNQSKIAATVINKDNSLGLVEGGYGISVSMNYIPQNEEIKVGDTIITSGLEMGMPKGLLLGTVEAVEKEAYQPFQKAVLKPFINLDKIFSVSVLASN